MKTTPTDYQAPPCSPETELAVLSTAVCYPEGYHRAAEVIGTSPVFYETEHAALWESIQDCYKATPDTRPDYCQLISHGGAPPLVNEVAGIIALPTNAALHARELVKLYRLRRARDLSATLARATDEQDTETSEAVIADMAALFNDTDAAVLPVADVGKADPPPDSLFQHGPAPGTFGLIVGGDGIGKGFVTLDLLLSTALGYPINLRTLTPTRPPLRCLYVSYEDDARILQWRLDRIAEAAYFPGVVWRDAEEAGMLTFMCDVPPLFEQGARDVPQPTPTLAALKAYIRKHHVDLCVVDPLNGAARLQREGNEEFNAVALPLRRIAHDTGCTMLLTHHTSKARQGDTDHQSLRGGGSLGNNARWVLKVTQDAQNVNALGLAVSKNSYGRRVYGITLERTETGVIRELSKGDMNESREALMKAVVSYVEDNPGTLNPNAVKFGRGESAKAFLEAIRAKPKDAHEAIERALNEKLLATEQQQKANRSGYVDVLIPIEVSEEDECIF